MTSPPALICHVIYRFAVGGLENGLVNLINNLPREAYRHAIICVTAASDFRERLRRSDVEICELRKRPGKDVAAYVRMWRAIRRLKPDIVHTRNLPALDMLVPAWLAGAPRFVHSEHGLDMLELDGDNNRYKLLRRLSRLAVDRYICVSRDLGQWLHNEVGIPEMRLNTIYNGVDTELFRPDGKACSAFPDDFTRPGKIVVATIGRLEAVKNQILLARAFCLALEVRPQLRRTLRLAIIGDGSGRRDIEATLAAAGARDLAWMPGFRNDAPALYRSFDIFVLPSRREGISNTLLEAMASGLPVVATRVGGNPEIVPDGVVGRLVPPDEAVLAQAIIDYVDAPELARRHGEAGRAHTLRSFSLAAMVESYHRVYRSLL